MKCCAECYNNDNEFTTPEFLVLNHPAYLGRDVEVCRHHLAIMFDWFSHEKTDSDEITIIKLSKERT